MREWAELTLLGHEQRDQDDVILLDEVVQQDSDGHHGCGARRHCGVHEQHYVVFNVTRQSQIVQLDREKQSIKAWTDRIFFLVRLDAALTSGSPVRSLVCIRILPILAFL